MLGDILGWLNPATWVGKIIAMVGGKVADTVLSWHKSNLDAANTQAAIKADLAKRAIALDQREAEVNAQTVQAEQGNWLTRSVRPLWSQPFIIYTWKVVVWDKVIGSFMGHACKAGDGCSTFSTDPLGDVVGPLMITIAASYFGARGIQYIVKEWQKPKMVATSAKLIGSRKASDDDE